MDLSEYLAELKDPSERLRVAGLQRLAALERATANGYPNAWTAKYHLDLLEMVERAVL